MHGHHTKQTHKLLNEEPPWLIFIISIILCTDSQKKENLFVHEPSMTNENDVQKMDIE